MRIKGSRIKRVENSNVLVIERKLSDGNSGEIGEYIIKHWEDLSKKRMREAFQTHFPTLANTYKTSLVFLDTETYGLHSSSPMFMTGLGYLVEAPKDVHVEMIFARDLFEEKAMLKYTIKKLEEQQQKENYGVVTYNGSSFDIPRLRDKARANGLVNGKGNPFIEGLNGNHIDLRKYMAEKKHELGLPDVRVSTIEKLILGHERRGDLSGQEMANAYHSFLYGKTIPRTKWIKDGKERKKVVVEKSRPVGDKEAIKGIEEAAEHLFFDVLSLVAITQYACAVRH